MDSYNSSCQNSKLFTNFFLILICDGMNISVAIIEFNSFFSLFGGLLNKIAVSTKCNLLIQGLLILINIVGKPGMNGNPVVQKGHWTKNILTMFRRLTAPQKFESFKLENPSSSTRCNIICFPFKSIFGSSYAVSVVSKLCKSKRLPIERIDQIKC